MFNQMILGIQIMSLLLERIRIRMGKSHRDNHQARKKIGAKSFEKKASRREEKKVKCNICGTDKRPHKIVNGMSSVC